MRKRICYIHVWPHKAGTTSIQWFLQENGADLLKHGYFLPESETKRGAHHALVAGLAGLDVGEHREPLVARSIAAIAETPAQAIVISSEALEGLLRNRQNTEAFFNRIRELSLEPKLILFPRNQPQWINPSYADTVKTFRRSDSFESIPPRVGQAAFQVEPCNLHLAANSRNQHEQPRICTLKVEEQHNAPVCPGVAMHEPLFSQMRYERILDLHVTPHGFRDDDVEHRHQMRHLFRFRTSHKRHVAREFLKKIIDRQFVICRMQHPLAQRTEVMREILRGGIHASSRHQKDFSCEWISHSGPSRKGADVDVISLG